MKKMNLISISLMMLLAACGSKSTEEKGPAVPGVPADVALKIYTDNSLTFQWKKVSGADSYEYQLLDPSGSALRGSTDVRNVTITGLKSGSTYRFSVRSVAGEAVSDWSAVVEAHTGGVF